MVGEEELLAGARDGDGAVPLLPAGCAAVDGVEPHLGAVLAHKLPELGAALLHQVEVHDGLRHL